jgi:phospholipid/cholesterol/gamma-HCH transport system permease protein
MSVVIRLNVDDEHARLIPTGSFDLTQAADIARAVAETERDLRDLDGRRAVILDLSSLERIDGSGAVLLAGLIDRLEARGLGTRCIEAHNPHAGRLIALYRHRTEAPGEATRTTGRLDRLGAVAARVPASVAGALDFVGHSAAALPAAIAFPRSVDWRSVPRLMQAIGADALPVTSAANLLIGLIIGFLGVSQLGRFGAVVYVPELVVIAQFRELGPLVTAIVVAGRSGAGLASELATMRVSEEIDALQSMGFDPVRWLVVPRCLALILTVPILTWIGDVLALGGGLLATIVISDLTPRAYILGTSDAITGRHFLTGMVKTPFLALAIGLIACGQGLAARGGASAVGARTTTAVVLAIFGAIVISALFTLFFTLLGI